MTSWLVVGLGLCLVAWRLAIALKVARDARRRGLRPRACAALGLCALFDARRYWWGARLERMPAGEAQALLLTAARRHRLASVTDVRCPLCDAEIPDALLVTPTGDLAARLQTACARCDFRVDACRHCEHFVPARGSPLLSPGGDLTRGSCSQYRSLQPVRAVYPDYAGHMESLGYDQIPAYVPIVDSYVPLDGCSAFTLSVPRLRRSEIPWLDGERAALVRLHCALVREAPARE